MTNPNAAYAFNWLQNRGYSPVAAAGVVGNLVQESGVSPGDGSGGGDGGRSHGIAQWNGSRLAGLFDYASQNGATPWNLDTQLGYLDWELKNRETGAYSRLQAAKDVPSATAAAIGYERPAGYTTADPTAGHGWSNRLNAASSLFSGAGAPIGPATPGSIGGPRKAFGDVVGQSSAPAATQAAAPQGLDAALMAMTPTQPDVGAQAAAQASAQAQAQDAARRAALIRTQVALPSAMTGLQIPSA